MVEIATGNFAFSNRHWRYNSGVREDPLIKLNLPTAAPSFAGVLSIDNPTATGNGALARWKVNGSDVYYFAANGGAQKPGGGSWAAISDARAKEAIVDYSAGLTELKQIQPRSYRYIGNEQTYIGLVAQEAEGAMPELVTQGTNTLPDGTEVDDFRTLDMTPLTFTLINAVKEMSTRIEALEAEVQALKGGNN